MNYIPKIPESPNYWSLDCQSVTAVSSTVTRTLRRGVHSYWNSDLHPPATCARATFPHLQWKLWVDQHCPQLACRYICSHPQVFWSSNVSSIIDIFYAMHLQGISNSGVTITRIPKISYQYLLFQIFISINPLRALIGRCTVSVICQASPDMEATVL